MSYPLPNVTVDLAIFAIVDDELNVLLIERGAEPFAGLWALPGGYIHVDEDEDIECAARRVLQEKTGVETPYLEQIASVGNAGRDPRGWTLSISYMALIDADAANLSRGGNATDVRWQPVQGEAVEPRLGFDHAEILKASVRRLRAKVEYSSLPAHLLPDRFTLPDLQGIYEIILGRKLEKSAFRKRIAEADFVEAVDGEKRHASNRPAQIYRLKDRGVTVLFDRVI